MGKSICLEHRRSWVGIPLEAALFFFENDYLVCVCCVVFCCFKRFRVVMISFIGPLTHLETVVLPQTAYVSTHYLWVQYNMKLRITFMDADVCMYVLFLL